MCILLTPIVGGNVSPLEDALLAGEVAGQLQVEGEDPGAGPGSVPRPAAVALLQQVPGQARGGGRHPWPVLRAQPELKISHVVGSQFHSHFDRLVLRNEASTSVTVFCSKLKCIGIKHKKISSRCKCLMP